MLAQSVSPPTGGMIWSTTIDPIAGFFRMVTPVCHTSL
jgi:hypothetical protein